ncbi:uncharacterized protein [Diadema setosum]|uniref:uncharacterized protein n=1 Tax=Diadema setosum TaxID=31175 RepID=UPI003B3B50A7
MSEVRRWSRLMEWNFQLVAIYRGQKINSKPRCDRCLREEKIPDAINNDPIPTMAPCHSQNGYHCEEFNSYPVMDYPIPISRETCCAFYHDDGNDDYDGLREVLLPADTHYNLTDSDMRKTKEMKDVAGWVYSKYPRPTSRREPLGSYVVDNRRRSRVRRRTDDASSGCGNKTDNDKSTNEPSSYRQEMTRNLEVDRSMSDVGHMSLDSGYTTRRQPSASDASCGVCESLLWDGDARPITPAENQDPAASHRGSVRAISFVAVCIHVIASTIVSVYGICDMFGKKKDVLEMISFFSYWLTLCSPTFIISYSNLVSYSKGGQYPIDIHKIGVKQSDWYPILHQDYVTRRLQYVCTAAVNKERGPRRWLAVLLIWIVINIGFEVTFNILSYREGWGTFEFIASIFMWYHFGIFCMFLSLMRKSFEQELEINLIFIHRNKDCIDWCRARMFETYRDLRLFNRAVHRWMLMCTNLCLMGIALHVSWNYLSFSDRLSEADVGKVINLDLLIVSERCLILCLPVAALHSFTDLNYLLAHFRLALSRQRRQGNEFFWDALIRYLDTLRYGNSCGSTHLKTLLTVFSFYVGLHLGWQDWNYHGFATTNTTFVVPSVAPTTE